MTQPEIPPLPGELLRRLGEPGSGDEARDCLPDPGTIWEVRSPDGELLLFLIVQRIESDEAASFAFVRAVPLSDFVHPTHADCAVVAVDTSALIYTAHCWLEGPVIADTLVRCLGKAAPASMDAVTTARAYQPVNLVNSSVAALRESLYEQFDPIFATSWERLYTCLDQASKSVKSAQDVSVTQSLLGEAALTKLSQQFVSDPTSARLRESAEPFFIAQPELYMAAAPSESKRIELKDAQGRVIQVDILAPDKRCRLFCDPEAFGPLIGIAINGIPVEDAKFNAAGRLTIPWDVMQPVIEESRSLELIRAPKTS